MGIKAYPPMNPFAAIPDLLRGRSPRYRHLALWVVVLGGAYGAVMGSFGSPGGGNRWVQAAYSAAKVPVLLGLSYGLTLPAFFVTSTLAGLRADFGRAVRATLAAPAGMAVVLASVAPFTGLWYASTADYGLAVLFNGAMFAVAVTAAGVVLRRAYRGLIDADPRHRVMLVAWLAAYAFTAVQMAWVLRPFIGSPGRTTFFRPDAWGNAYLKVGEMVWRAL